MEVSNKQRICVVNTGLYRSGTTSLAEAAKSLGLTAFRDFPYLTRQQHRSFLFNPEQAVHEWFFLKGGIKEIVRLCTTNDIICDGWIALLPFLSLEALEQLKHEALKVGTQIQFVATLRDVASTVLSELQHWVIHDLEERAGLTPTERENLEFYLRSRAESHRHRLFQLQKMNLLQLLLLEGNVADVWPRILSSVTSITNSAWSEALAKTGKQNSNPDLPIEGILLTMRFGTAEHESNEKVASVERLLGQIEQDRLCRYIIVLGIDYDELGNESQELIQRLKKRADISNQLLDVHIVINAPTTSGEPFPLCAIWNDLAVEAWNNGADWVVLLGDDIQIQCQFHYRAVYRSFLEIASRLNVAFGFGCPWLNDVTFPGFPTFPCVGKTHFDIFGRLIPEHRQSIFVNQDLDPYLQSLYLKFMAAPCVSEAKLSNGTGGNADCSRARYKRVEAVGWRDFVHQDVDLIRCHVPEGTKEAILLDVIVPSFRIRLDYLDSICSLKVPEYMFAHFILIIDNPDLLRQRATEIVDSNETFSLHQAERILEEHLSRFDNIVRVRCNAVNRGASASRNRGLDETAGEFFLNLDDDLRPDPDLLKQYGDKLLEHVISDSSVVGLIGLVHFPRDQKLPLQHAAVLMSYLTFMFEIARSNLYEHPAWGVTANILFRRTSVRFDVAYAKTGGGEDVDFCLHVAGENGKLLKVPEARVVHPFWSDSVLTLSGHFFNWAVGDGTLLTRFPKYRYWSFPNVPETFLVLAPLALVAGIPGKLVTWMIIFLSSDFLVDFFNRSEYKHRCDLLGDKRCCMFYFTAHILANIYVVILECGRLYGHLTRFNLSGLFHRFDWHCARLERAPLNFRKREALKFLIFCVLVLLFEIAPYARFRHSFLSRPATAHWTRQHCEMTGEVY